MLYLPPQKGSGKPVSRLPGRIRVGLCGDESIGMCWSVSCGLEVRRLVRRLLAKQTDSRCQYMKGFSTY